MQPMGEGSGAAQHPWLLRPAYRLQHRAAEPGPDDLDRLDLTRSCSRRCDAHGWMLGWIYVVDNPYYALTGTDGKFSITDVPPGEYSLVA